MSDKSNALSRVVRWGAVGLLVCVAIVLYFRMGVHVEPLTAAPQVGERADTTAP
jgi:uncharacterized membrane protein